MGVRNESVTTDRWRREAIVNCVNVHCVRNTLTGVVDYFKVATRR
jgi:hypothetical protein